MQYRGLILWQDDGLPCFTADSVLLVHFFADEGRIRRGDRVLDAGCGTGVLSVLGNGYTEAAFTGFDVLEGAVTLANRSAAENGQGDVNFVAASAEEAPGLLGHGSFTAAVCNPPYFHGEAEESARSLARHGGREVLSAMLRASFLLLKNGGRFFCCYPAEGLTDLLCALRENRLEPKRLRTVVSAPGKEPYLVLAEAKKDGAPGIRMLPPLTLNP